MKNLNNGRDKKGEILKGVNGKKKFGGLQCSSKKCVRTTYKGYMSCPLVRDIKMRLRGYATNLSQ